MDYLQLISIALEAVIAGLFLKSAIKGKNYLYGISITFLIYVFYDLAKLFSWDFSSIIINIAFFIATLGALYSAWMIGKRK